MSNIEIYFDCDGVLADFMKSVESKASTELKDLRTKLGELDPELADMHIDDMKPLFAGPQTDPVLKQAKKIYLNYYSKFYNILKQEGFFYELDVLPGAIELITGAARLNGGKLPHILTAPVDGPHCKPEKEAWVKKHLDGLYDRFICQKEKYEYSNENSVLIDDMTKNTVPWNAAGGFAILYKGNVADALAKLEDYIVNKNSNSYMSETKKYSLLSSLIEQVVLEVVEELEVQKLD